MDEFFRDDEDFFFPVFRKGAFEPEMDVYETDNEVVAELSVPDIDPNNINVSVEGDVLKVNGEFEEKDEEGEEGKSYWKREIRKGSFSRAVRLPARVDDDKAEAVYEKGVLKVTLPKATQEEGKSKKIEVKSK